MMSTGCTTVVFNAARLAKEDRTTASQFADTQIGASVLSSLVEKDKNFLIDVNVDVWEARVLLTGTVSNSKTRQEVVHPDHGVNAAAETVNWLPLTRACRVLQD